MKKKTKYAYRLTYADMLIVRYELVSHSTKTVLYINPFDRDKPGQPVKQLKHYSGNWSWHPNLAKAEAEAERYLAAEVKTAEKTLAFYKKAYREFLLKKGTFMEPSPATNVKGYFRSWW